MLNKKNDFFFIFEGGWKSEIEGPAIGLDIVGQLNMIHDSLIGLLCAHVFWERVEALIVTKINLQQWKNWVTL